MPSPNLNLCCFDQLSDVGDPHRTAQFVSTIALVTPDGAEHVVEGAGRAGSPSRHPDPAGSATTRSSSPTGRMPAPSAPSGSGPPRRRTRVAPRPRVPRMVPLLAIL